jgi:ribulose-5-phosphate 4-epimerase/fuculose-1-phosphate aldolase
MNEQQLRDEIVLYGRSIVARGLTHGRTGNLSIRSGDRVLLTPTGHNVGRLDADRLSVVDLDGQHLSGPAPTKECGLHLAFYRRRPDAGAVVHLHSPHATAVSCLRDIDPTDVLPPLTAYYPMRLGRVPLVDYHPPGSPELTAAVEAMTGDGHALLLANHGPIVSGPDLESAADAIEELEHTAQIFLMMGDRPSRPIVRPSDG